jgi:hypothetical protein
MPYPSLEPLLKPSLQSHAMQGAMYSTTAHGFVAFFGGPLAVALFSLWGARRIGLLRRHALLYAAFLLLALTAVLGIVWLRAHTWPGWFNIGGTPAASARYSLQLTGLALFGLIYWRMGPYFRIGTLNQRPPSPWLAAIVCIALAILAIMLTAGVLLPFLDR